jgi:hypothetical protein
MSPKVTKARTASPATESIGGISEKITISIQLIYLFVILKLAIFTQILATEAVPVFTILACLPWAT